MKLLLDENLSDRIIVQVLGLYPGSTHIKSQGLARTSDTLIWSFAKQNGYTIVSKDADFHQRSLVYGHPPKFVYLRVGNCPTNLTSSRCFAAGTPGFPPLIWTRTPAY